MRVKSVRYLVGARARLRLRMSVRAGAKG